jgi:hypothetical protein
VDGSHACVYKLQLPALVRIQVGHEWFLHVFSISHENETDMDMRRGFDLTKSYSSRVFLLFLLLIDKICPRDGESKKAG